MSSFRYDLKQFAGGHQPIDDSIRGSHREASIIRFAEASRYASTAHRSSHSSDDTPNRGPNCFCNKSAPAASGYNLKVFGINLSGVVIGIVMLGP